MSKTRRTYSLTDEMKTALATSPVDFIASWWERNATDEERKSAEERGATPSGAFAFVESVAKKHKKKSSACLPDDLTYQLAGIFLRNGADGDEFLTEQELKEIEEREVKSAERKKDAEKKEAERKAALTPEQKAEEERIEKERREVAEREEQKRKELQAARDEAKKRTERAKAIAAEMARNQLTFDF